LNASQPSVLPISKIIPDFYELFIFHKANIEALVQASTVLAKGMGEIGKHFASLAQVEWERAGTTAKATLAVKSLPDVIMLNTDYANVCRERLVATTTLQCLGVKVAQDAVAPINARVTVAVEAVGKPLKTAAAVENQAKPAA
jgi:hypothetical protein